MTQLGILTDVLSKVVAYVPKIIIFCTLLSAISAVIESLFKKKYLGLVIWKGIFSFFSAPGQLKKSNEEIKNQLEKIKNEVTFNGGKILLKDAVARIESNIRGISMDLRANDELDNLLKFKFDEFGKMKRPNRAFLEHFGFTESDLIGGNYENQISIDYRQNFRNELQRSIQNKSDFRWVGKIIDKEDAEHRCVIHCIPLIEDSGTLWGFNGVIEIKI